MTQGGKPRTNVELLSGDIADPLTFDGQRRLTVRLDPAGPLVKRADGTLGARLAAGLKVLAGALGLNTSDSIVTDAEGKVHARPTTSQVRNASGVGGATLSEAMRSALEHTARKGQPNGYAELDARGVLPLTRTALANSAASLDASIQVPGAQLGGASFGGAGTKVLRDNAPPDWGAVPAAALPTHASTHQHGGSDEVATATPAANAIPKANGSNKLAAGWLSEVLALADLSDVTAKTGVGTVAVMQQFPTLDTPALTTPFIADYSNANHTHASVAQGGGLPAGSITSGTIAVARLPAASTSAAGIIELATDYEDAATAVLGTDSRLVALVARSDKVARSTLSRAATGFAMGSGDAYFVYLGRTTEALTWDYVRFTLRSAGSGAQTAEVGLFSSTGAPDRSAGFTMTALATTGTVDDLTTTGVKGNTSAFATAVSAGTHLWAGIRCAMATTQPSIYGLLGDNGHGRVQSIGGSGALTGAGPFNAAVVTDTGVTVGPDLEGALD